ncbi:hypothetical protein Fot_28290 [Forsythia ovata]|uniref:Uncharacterized protein n=1 Tax=Forsythia ovata TaxID=205694 RepID=A0ABD1TNL7_9LAMI
MAPSLLVCRPKPSQTHRGLGWRQPRKRNAKTMEDFSLVFAKTSQCLSTQPDENFRLSATKELLTSSLSTGFSTLLVNSLSSVLVKLCLASVYCVKVKIELLSGHLEAQHILYPWNLKQNPQIPQGHWNYNSWYHQLDAEYDLRFPLSQPASGFRKK